jgi:hypothetical protein
LSDEPITVPQRDGAWVRKSTPVEIHSALHRGELAVLLGGTAPIDFDAVLDAGRQLSRDDLGELSSEQIVQAQAAGLLDDVMKGK